jgi:integrase
MQGHIEERRDRGKGVYRLRVDAGNDPLTGKRRQLSRTIRVTGPRPRQQAEQKLRAFLNEVDGGRHRSTLRGGMTVGQAVEDWFVSFRAAVAAGSKSPGTARKYREVIDAYIRPQLGQLPLAEFTTELLDSFYEQLLVGGRTGHARKDGSGHGAGAGGPLSPATVRNVHTVLRLVCARAVRYRWVPAMTSNPAIEASPPGLKKRKKTPPTSEQAQALLARAERMDPDWHCYLLVSASVGSRRGEVTGLHHSAFNLANVRRAAVRIETALTVGLDGIVETEAPKSDAGFRTVALGERTARAVRDAIKRQRERALECGGRLVADPYLFAETIDGSVPWDPRRVSRRFRYLRDQLGFKTVRLNDLRHYVATQLLGKGVDVITVAGRLGHDPAITQRVYAEFIAENDRVAATIMERLLNSRTS